MADRLISNSEKTLRSSPAMMARMSAMMFLQYGPLGLWGVTVGTYIAANTGAEGTGVFSAGFVGYSTAAGAIGSLLSPVIVGFLSDRYFAAERLVALMHVGCAIAVGAMFASQSQIAFFFWLLFYFQCFSPAAALTNKIALQHLSDSDAEYPLIRIFGTLGWIVAGVFVGFAWPLASGHSIEETRIPLMLGACASALMALYALTLPNTPSDRRSGDFLFRAVRDSRQLLNNRPLVLFLLVSILACIPSMAYNNYGNLFLNNQGYPRPAALMTLGQASDVLVLSASPWLIARFGLRSLFAGGVLAWGIRYSLLAAGSYYDAAWPVYAAILIHGFCYVLVYVIGVMYVDRLVGDVHRGAAQGMYALVSGGLANILGALSVGYSQAMFLTPEGVSPAPYHWTPFWLVPAVISVGTLLIFQLAFRPIRNGFHA